MYEASYTVIHEGRREGRGTTDMDIGDEYSTIFSGQRRGGEYLYCNLVVSTRMAAESAEGPEDEHIGTWTRLATLSQLPIPLLVLERYGRPRL